MTANEMAKTFSFYDTLDQANRAAFTEWVGLDLYRQSIIAPHYDQYANISISIGISPMATDETPGIDLPDNPLHKAVREVLDGLAGRAVVPDARKALGKALDKADKPETGRLPDGTHRAPVNGAFR